jgi:hypothetical protein
MSDIEDLVSQVMAAHDDEAPRAADLLRGLAGAELPAPGPGDRPRSRTALWRRSRAAVGWPTLPYRSGWLIPVGAAAAVAAVMAGIAFAGGRIGGGPTLHQVNRVPSLSCPAKYHIPPPWVPDRPTGVDGRSRLVPLRTPASAVVCGYDPDLKFKNLADHLAGRTLTGQRRLTGGLGVLAGDLAWQPRLLHGQQILCALVLGPQYNYLIGLTYPGDGRIWVSTTSDPSGCVMSSNGEFTSWGNASAEAAKALRTGRWPGPPREVSCGFGGRLGQETVMVPAGSTSLTICAGRVVRTFTSGYQRLVNALNALPTHLSTRGCSSRPPYHGQNYELEFAYPRGPGVQVRISAYCFPEIDNLSLQANSARTILPLISWLMQFAGGPQVTLRPDHGPVGTRVTVTGSGFTPGVVGTPVRLLLLNRTFPDGCSLVGGTRVNSLHVSKDGTLRGQFVITAQGACFQQPGRHHPVTPGVYQLAIGCMACDVHAFLVTGTPRH